MCQAADVLRTVPEAIDPFDWRAVLANRRPPRQAGPTCPAKLVLLGTAGGANPKGSRAGYANAVVVGDAAYLVDCGEGVHTQLYRAGLTVNPHLARDRARPVVSDVFLTHLHADHVMDLVNLFVGSWSPQPITVTGPGPAGLPIPSFPPDAMRPLLFPDDPTPGTAAMVRHLFQAFAYNLNVRIADEGRVDPVALTVVREIGVHAGADVPLGVEAGPLTDTAPAMDPVVVHPEDEHGVTVRATLVAHAPVFPALGYRIDTPTGSVAFSGDTGPCDNVVRLAQGADVLVHEVIDLEFLTRRVRTLPNFEAIRNHLAHAHTPPEAVADIARRAGVGTLVLSHLVPGDAEFSEAEWEARVREAGYDGDVVCGVELDEFALC